MKFICNQRALTGNINIATKAINIKSTKDILKGLKITAKDSKVEILGKDAEMSIRTVVEADVVEEGEIVINARLLSDIIKKLPDSFVDVNVDMNNHVEIECLNSKFKIQGLPAEDYVRVDAFDEELMYEIPGDVLRSMIRQTVFSVSQDPTRTIFMGELFEIKDSSLTLVAVDGYRLAIKKCALEGNFEDSSVIIPGKVLQDINSLIGDSDKVKIGFKDKNVHFKIGETEISANLLEGKFHNYNRWIPNEYITTVRLKTQELLDAMERASIIVNSEKNNLVRLEISEGKLELFSNTEVGDVHEVVQCDKEGEDMLVAFNSRYFIEGLKHIDSEEIYLRFEGVSNPCVVTPVDDENYIYLLLPVRVSR